MKFVGRWVLEMSAFLFVCVVFLLVGFPAQGQNLNCSEGDLNSLRSFVELLWAPPEGWNFNSSSVNCCNWDGITCNSLNNDGRVVKLELGKKRLHGNISEYLGNLDQLRILNLSHNSLQGSIPQSLLQLPYLEILDLSNNLLSGLFPDSTNLSSIQVLNISSNTVAGAVPVGICKTSSKITALNLADNNFSGNLSSGLGNCNALTELILATNMIFGDLPEDIFRLPSLTRLNLQENMFSGQLSDHIGNLSNLVFVDVSMNMFTGTLPNVFDRFKQLQQFSSESNNFSGSIPVSLANSPTIVTLSLRNNSLRGKIDLNCSAMVSLATLNLATNEFSGEIPDYLPNCLKLRTVNLARTKLRGTVPDSFKNFPSLVSLSLSNSSFSNLTTALDVLQHCKNLTTLVLSVSFRGEVMPDNPLQFDSLKILVIASCRLTGRIPQWLSGCKNLQLLDLSWNRLEGPIPTWFGSLQALFYLDLSNNTIGGDIPIELTQMQSLINGGNALMDGSYLDFPFFVKRRGADGDGYKYRKALSFPPTLELGNNNLTGHIWPEFGNLKEVHVFDLKANQLTGSIPSSLSGMKSLEILDLSSNSLTGVIPPSLTSLNFLRNFSVAYNNLSGRVPEGGQFSTFYYNSFEGNSGLCGEHTPLNCPGDRNDTQGGTGERPKGAIIAMGIGIGLGSVFIIALVYVIILCSCPRKVADQENEDSCISEMNETSSLVILCQSKGDDGQIFLDDLLKSTANFDQSNIIGCGGFGLVYKAELSDGRKVAIKRLSGEYFQMEREFQAEIETLSRAKHPNLVPLQGYCKYKTDRLLIYTYMENGSLDYWLHEKTDGPSSLDWETRLRIAQGAARGLAYLHLSCDPHILHRDIKSSNILLNENFDAHLADFGLARLILPYDTHVTTDLVGTLGYIPPEYSQASVATYKGDIYSFGVVLLELLTGKRPMDMCRPKGCRDLISWVSQMKMEKKETEVFDPFIYDKEHAREMLIILEIACICLNENPRIRPGVQQLVSWLDNIDSISVLESS